MGESKSTICCDLTNALKCTNEFKDRLSYIKLCYEGKDLNKEMVRIRFKDGHEIIMNVTENSALKMLKRILYELRIFVEEYYWERM